MSCNVSPIKKLIKFFKFSKQNNIDDSCPVVCKKNLDVSEKLCGLIKRLQDAGYEAYIVGGAVRDLLLHRDPKDYDIATSATPEQIREVFGRRQARIIGKRFRLVHVYLGQSIIEVSTFRRTPPSPGKMPAVLKKKSGKLPGKLIFDDNSFGTAKEDAFRRDFTVNALFYDPFTGEIKDYTGMGLADIESGTVRVIGLAEERFEEDPVRLLRALKLVGQYGFKLEETTESVLRTKIHLIAHASPSRLALELEKILKATYSHSIFTAFRQYGMLKYFLPELEKIFSSGAGKCVLELLRIRNERVMQGCYKNSVSIPMAILSLPLIWRTAEVGTGELWQRESFEYKELANIVRKSVAPHAMMRCLTEMAAGALNLLPELIQDECRRRINPALRQHTAELILILNDCLWKSETIANGSFTRNNDGENKTKTEKRCRRRYCRRKNAKKEQQMPEDAVAAVGAQ